MENNWLYRQKLTHSVEINTPHLRDSALYNFFWSAFLPILHNLSPLEEATCVFLLFLSITLAYHLKTLNRLDTCNHLRYTMRIFTCNHIGVQFFITAIPWCTSSLVYCHVIDAYAYVGDAILSCHYYCFTKDRHRTG